MRISLNHPKRADSISPFLGPEWLAQRKLDGVRLAVLWDGAGFAGTALSKGGIELAPPRGLPPMPPGTVVDGELIGSTWEDSLASVRRLLNDGEVPASLWRPFDLGGPTAPHSLPERLDYLREFGLDPEPAGPVNEVWTEALDKGWEGVVVRRKEAGYLAPAFKVKPERTFNALAHLGFLHVIEGDGYPRAVGRCSAELSGRVRVECEGVTRHGRVRAPRVLGPVPDTATVSAAQLERLARP